MTVEPEERWAKRALASSVFKPSVPIDSLAIFRGRGPQVDMAIEAINQLGQNPVIYGERGVGKTSLAKVLGEILDQAQISGWKSTFVTCDARDTFESLWRKAFGKLVVTDNEIVLAESIDTQRDLKRLSRLSDWLEEEVTPSDVARVAALAQGHLIVIFDEFDQLAGRADIAEPMANTIKTLSDQHVNVTTIIVGVADSVDELLEEHPSTERNLAQVEMPRMSRAEIEAVIKDGLGELGFTISDDAMSHIASIVQGLPSPTHRIGLQIAYVLIDAGRTECVKSDVSKALDSVCEQLSASQLRAWEDATGSSRKNALFEEVLIACALTPRSDLGWFSPVDVLDPFQAVTGRKDYGISTYSQHLHLLADGRGEVLEKEQREGQAKRFRFRFTNPLFQAFVVMNALRAGQLTDALLQQFEENLAR